MLTATEEPVFQDTWYHHLQATLPQHNVRVEDIIGGARPLRISVLRLVTEAAVPGGVHLSC